MRRIHASLLIAAALTLSSCSWLGWGEDDAASLPPPMASQVPDVPYMPGCPEVTIIRDLSIYQHPPAANENDLVINTRMGKIRSKCGGTDDGYQVDGNFDIMAIRGANSAGKLANLPFFISVVNEKEDVLRRDLYEIPVTFEGDGRQVRLTIPFSVSVPKPASGSMPPKVLIGFHLSQEQLEANSSFMKAGR